MKPKQACNTHENGGGEDSVIRMGKRDFYGGSINPPKGFVNQAHRMRSEFRLSILIGGATKLNSPPFLYDYYGPKWAKGPL